MKNKIFITIILFTGITISIQATTNGTGQTPMYNEVKKVVHSIYPKAKYMKWECKKMNRLFLNGMTTVYYGCIAELKNKRKIGMQCEELYMSYGKSMTNCKFTRYLR